MNWRIVLKKYSLLIVFFMTAAMSSIKSQTYPSFEPEIDVTITGRTLDAMEPFISPDGNILFFNNRNDGVNTKLYFAERENDTLFHFIGELNGVNQLAPPHLDAIADMDSSGNFYWTSTRDYPSKQHNLFHGSFQDSMVENIGRVHGDFYKDLPGWIVMDHGISYDGQFLYYNNARFDGVCTIPCETEIGIARKINDSTFNKITGSDSILQNINDPNYIYYAPNITSDHLEFYYTRLPNSAVTPNTIVEICVAVRNTPTEIFFHPPGIVFRICF